MRSATGSKNSNAKRRRIGLIAATALPCAFSAAAAEILESDVRHNDGRYTVHFDVRLDAPPDKLRPHLTDYANYAKHAKSITESTVLGKMPSGATRIRLRLRSCFLFFCRNATMVKDITEQPDGTIQAQVDPALSDFRETTEQWRLTAEGNRTRLQYRAELTPTFYVPPLIGPWILKRRMRELLEINATKFETLAHE